MRVLVLCVALLALSSLASSFVLSRHAQRHGHKRREQVMVEKGQLKVDAMPPAMFYNQTLDHFDNLNTATYQQRYFVNTTFWNPSNGPVFLYIEGEGAASAYDVLYGHHMEMAKVFNALVIAVEHRYYGASVPTADLSTPNLRWLSSQQALSDLAEFHAFAVQQYNITANNTWICFGGSYPGALSAWFRLKFPHLVYASVASSAPVRAKDNFERYNEVVAESLGTPLVGGSLNCALKTMASFKALQVSLENGTGQLQLQQMFNTCEPLLNATFNDTMTFVENVAGVFQGIVQYNDEIPASLNISNVCSIFANISDPLTALAQIVNVSQNGVCLDISYAKALLQLANVTVDPNAAGVGDRQWTYQTCTQFGYYQTCDANTTCPFLYPPMNLESNIDLCVDLFGVDGLKVANHVAFSNDYYGSDHPDGSRILFVNGHVDPWHALSVLQDIPDTNQTAIFIEGTAHCANMQSSSPSDPPALVQARIQIEQQVAAWIADSRTH